MPIRALRIAGAFVAFLFALGLSRVRPGHGGPELARQFRTTLERLGPTFVKFGQALSLRRDLVPEEYLHALAQLHDQVAPFPTAVTRKEVEAAFERPLSELFDAFVDEPMAAASIGQVHRARLRDGRDVVVKIRRPGIRRQIDSDMRTLRAVVRLLLVLIPGLGRLQPLRLVQETWTNLRQETDFHQEARNIRRFVEAFSDREKIDVPEVIEGLATEAVLVQRLSGGHRVDDPAVQPDGPRLAQVLVDAYLHQFFVMGQFHGDPHPATFSSRRNTTSASTISGSSAI